MLQHTGDHGAVAPLIVVPRNELDKVVIQHDAGRLVKDAGAGIADQVGGHHLIAGIADDALHVRLRGVEHLVADVGIGHAGAQPCGQIHHRYVRRGDAERHAGHLALQGGDHAAHGLGCTGGGGDDVVQDGAAGTPVAAAAGVHRLLLGSRGVDSGHQGLLDTELLVDHISQRRQAVGGAAGVGDHAHIGAILVTVDAVNKGGRGVILGGRRQDDLLGAALEVTAGLVGGVVGAGGLDDILGTAVRPVDHGGIRLAVDLDLVAVDHQIAAGVLHRAGEVPEDGVVLQQVHHVVDVRLAQVDTADLELFRVLRKDTHDNAADTAKSVDTDFDSHDVFLSFLSAATAVFVPSTL